MITNNSKHQKTPCNFNYIKDDLIFNENGLIFRWVLTIISKTGLCISCKKREMENYDTPDLIFMTQGHYRA